MKRGSLLYKVQHCTGGCCITVSTIEDIFTSWFFNRTLSIYILLCYVEQVGDRRILKIRRSLFTESWKMICGTTDGGQEDDGLR